MPGLARRILLGAVAPGLLLVAWWIAARAEGGVVVPGVGEVAAIAAAPWRTPRVIDAPPLGFSAVTSVLRVALGFAAAALAAVPLGLAMGRLRTVRQAVSPFAAMIRVVCPLAWLPLAIVAIGDASFSRILFGPAEAWRYEALDHLQAAMVLIIALGAFFPILLATAAGASAVRRTLLESATLMGAGPWARFRHVVWPAALPAVLNGMRIGLGVGWMVIVAAELYPGTRSGLGYTIWVAHQTAQYGYAFAAILYIMLLGLAINAGLHLLERRVGHWQAAQR